jgi:WD40 repeat protein
VFMIQQNNVCGVGWPAPGIVVLVRHDGSFAFHDTTSRSERFAFHGDHPAGYVDPRVVFSGDGRWLIALRGLWDLAPTAAALVAGTSPVPDPVKRDAPGEYLVDYLYAVSQDGRLALRGVARDLRENTVQQLLSLPELEVQGVCPGPEPALPYAATLSDRFIVWYEQRFPPYKQAQIYALEGGVLQAILPHKQGITAVTFSRDGRLVATSAVGTVRVWDPESGECVRKFKGQRGTVRAVAFHPSGRFLAAGCPDGTVRFWDVDSGKELRRYDWAISVAQHLAFSPDGETVAASTALAVVVWDVEE